MLKEVCRSGQAEEVDAEEVSLTEALSEIIEHVEALRHVGESGIFTGTFRTECRGNAAVSLPDRRITSPNVEPITGVHSPPRHSSVLRDVHLQNLELANLLGNSATFIRFAKASLRFDHGLEARRLRFTLELLGTSGAAFCDTKGGIGFTHTAGRMSHSPRVDALGVPTRSGNATPATSASSSKIRAARIYLTLLPPRRSHLAFLPLPQNPVTRIFACRINDFHGKVFLRLV